MIRIGIVDPDTSHPDGFIPILNESGRARVVAVQNDYAVKDFEETKEFVKKYNIQYRGVEDGKLATVLIHKAFESIATGKLQKISV